MGGGLLVPGFGRSGRKEHPVASRVRIWAYGVAGVLALLAIILLPPGDVLLRFLVGTYRSNPADRTPAELVERNLGSELISSAMVLKRKRRLDTILSLLDANSSGTAPVRILPAGVFQADTAEALLRLARMELDRSSPREQEMDVLVVGLDWQYGLEGYRGPDPGYYSDQNKEWYMLPHTAGGACVVLLPLFPRQSREWGLELASLNDPARTSQLLGPCRLYGRYGAPGKHLEEWLQAIGYVRAMYSARPREEEREPLARRYVFGPFRAWGVDLTEEACIAGRVEACRTIFLGSGDPQDPYYRISASYQRRQELWMAYLPELLNPSFRVGGLPDLLSNLESWHGPDRFQRFWSSDRPVEEAFREAFGETPGEWVMEFERSLARVEPNGPGIPLTGLILTLVTLLGLTGLVALVAGRRQVA
jgi:hypothetical protein